MKRKRQKPRDAPVARTYTILIKIVLAALATGSAAGYLGAYLIHADPPCQPITGVIVWPTCDNPSARPVSLWTETNCNDGTYVRELIFDTDGNTDVGQRIGGTTP